MSLLELLKNRIVVSEYNPLFCGQKQGILVSRD